MRDHGKSTKELAGLFGYSQSALEKSAALGFVPNLSKLSGRNGSEEDAVSMRDAFAHLLPFRAWPASIPKNDKALDYSECVTAIDKLAAGELLPSSSGSSSSSRSSESSDRSSSGSPGEGSDVGIDCFSAIGSAEFCKTEGSFRATVPSGFFPAS